MLFAILLAMKLIITEKPCRILLMLRRGLLRPRLKRVAVLGMELDKEEQREMVEKAKGKTRGHRASMVLIANPSSSMVGALVGIRRTNFKFSDRNIRPG